MPVIPSCLGRSGFVPLKGKLTLAFVNVAAYLKWDRHRPGATRFVDQDMNRVCLKAPHAADLFASLAGRTR